MRSARRAGDSVANVAASTKHSSPAANPITSTVSRFCRTMRLRTSRERAAARIAPATAPAAIGLAFCVTSMPRIWRGVAPIAIRMPSSRRLCARAKATSANIPAAASAVATAPIEPKRVTILRCASRRFSRDPRIKVTETGSFTVAAVEGIKCASTAGSPRVWRISALPSTSAPCIGR